MLILPLKGFSSADVDTTLKVYNIIYLDVTGAEHQTAGRSLIGLILMSQNDAAISVSIPVITDSDEH